MELKICVRCLLGGSEYLVQALPSWQVRKLKEEIRAQTGILELHQRLTFRMETLQDARPLSDYHLEHECEVDLQIETMITLHIATFYYPCSSIEEHCKYNMDLQSLDVDVYTTIAHIKVLIKQSASAAEYKIFFEGRELKNDKTLEQYGIQSNDVLCIEGVIEQLQSFPRSSEPRSSDGLLTVVASHGFSRLDVPAKMSDTVSTFKTVVQRVAEKTAEADYWEMEFPTEGQHLFYGGEELRDTCTLAHYGIDIGASLLYLRQDSDVVLTCLDHEGVSLGGFLL